MVVFQLGGSVPAIATALQLSAFSLMWPLQHRNPPLIGKIRKLQIIKKDLVFVCCRAEQGGKVLLSLRFICWWWLAEIGRKGAISQPLSSLLHPPHCCFTHFKYKDKDTEKDKYKVLIFLKPLSSLLHPPHCYFTHFKYKDTEKEKDKYKVLIFLRPLSSLLHPPPHCYFPHFAK